LVEEVRDALKVWLGLYEITADFGASWLFLNKNAEPMGVNAVQEMVAGAAQKCGIGHVTPHMLRHTFCHRTLSNLVRKGAGDKALITVAKMAGHSRLDVTMRYVTPSDEEMLALLEG
jgi:integrase